MVYSPTVSPVTRVGVPVSVSDPTSAPVAVANVSVGSEPPYVLVLATAVTVIGLALIGAALFAWALLRNQKGAILRPETQAVKKLEHKLAQLGYRRKAGETLSVFIQRVLYSEPQLKTGLTHIAQLFEQVAYQNRPEQLSPLQEAVRQFPR